MARYKGAVDRSAQLRRRQADQGQEATHPGRQARAVAARPDHCRRCAGPRWRCAATIHLFGQFPFLCKLFANSACAGPVFANGIAHVMPNLVTEIVRRRDHTKGFVVEPQRWIVERSDVAASPRIGRTATTTRLPSFTLPRSASCSENSVIPHEVSGRTLKRQGYFHGMTSY
jgi:hypothetical protein